MGVSGPSGPTLEGVTPSLSYYAGMYTTAAQLSGLASAIRGTGPRGRLYGARSLRRQHRLCRRVQVDGLHDRPGHAGGRLESAGRDRLRHGPEHVSARRLGGCRWRLSVLAGRGYSAECWRPDADGHVHADRRDRFQHGAGNHHDPGRSGDADRQRHRQRRCVRRRTFRRHGGRRGDRRRVGREPRRDRPRARRTTRGPPRWARP